MVFSSIPAYYHEPTNWQQQINQPTGGSGVNTSHLLPPPPPPPPPPSQPHGGGGGGGGSGTIRPGSLADRARMANIPMPEAALKCPRCESTNTKFCYFNNYSLSQPRHFCKTCRRYWTRGGSLRNVPVGGGCRRNRRSSKGGSSSKSPVSSSDHQMGTNNSVNSSSSITSNAIGSSTADILGLTQQIPNLHYMAGLSNLTEFPSNEIGLNYGMNNYGGLISSQMSGLSGDLNFQIGSGLLGGHGTSRSLLSDQWRLQPPSQFPFLAGGSDPSSGLFYEGGGGGELLGYQVRPKPSSSGLTQQMASVKMEEDRINFSRQLFGSIEGRNDQYWNGGTGTSTTAAWTDASGFNSSS